MDIQSAIRDKVLEIEAECLRITGRTANVSIWAYRDAWTIHVETGSPGYVDAFGRSKDWTGIDAEAGLAIGQIGEKISHKPSAAEIASKLNMTEGELCEIVCAAKHAEAAE